MKFNCRNADYGNWSEPYDSVEQFLEMCEECFGQVPDLYESYGKWFESETNNLVLEPIIKAGYVTNGTKWLVQVPDDTKFGFSLHDEDQAWPGGFGAFYGGQWKLVPAEKVPAIIKIRLGWILEQ